jgi:hypothetical protein
MHPPPFVRRRRQAPGEQYLLVFAEASNFFPFSEKFEHFFFAYPDTIAAESLRQSSCMANALKKPQSHWIALTLPFPPGRGFESGRQKLDNGNDSRLISSISSHPSAVVGH